jgi:hypothetical protein
VAVHVEENGLGFRLGESVSDRSLLPNWTRWEMPFSSGRIFSSVKVNQTGRAYSRCLSRRETTLFLWLIPVTILLAK